MTVTDASRHIEQLFRAIESRDLRSLVRVLAPEVTWRNVPEPPSVGLSGVLRLLGSVTLPSEEVRWEIERLSVSGQRAHVERVDRFLLEGEWLEVWCHGVFEFDSHGRTVSVSDYVDLAEWRSRIGAVLERLAQRSPEQIAASMMERSGPPIERLGSVMSPDVSLEVIDGDSTSLFNGWVSVIDELESRRLVDESNLVAFCPLVDSSSHEPRFRSQATPAQDRLMDVRVDLLDGRIAGCSVVLG